MVGTGAIFWRVPTHKRRWINDVNPYVIRHLNWLRGPHAGARIRRARRMLRDPLVLEESFIRAKTTWTRSPLAYLILSRFAFGQVYCNGRSDIASFCSGEGKSLPHPDRIAHCHDCLQDARITCGDYLPLLQESGKDVFIFIDPPYLLLRNAAHDAYAYPFTVQQNIDMAKHVRACPHKWLMTNSDCAMNRDLYSGFTIEEIPVKYSGLERHYERVSTNEIIIRNY